MKKPLWFVALVAAVLLFATASSDARPGGGGRRGGGAGPGAGGAGRAGSGPSRPTGGQSVKPGNFGSGQSPLGGKAGSLPGPGGGLPSAGGAKPGQSVQEFLGISSGDRGGLQSQASQLQGKSSQLQGQASQWQRQASQLKAQYAPANEPFSPAWYADHPQAWQYTHPHADAAVAATFTAATAWLGWAATQPAGSYSTTYVTTDSSGEVAAEPEQTAQASQLAAGGAAPVETGGDWLPLGAYALAPKNQTDATYMIQLTVNKDGVLRGSYYDILSNQGQTVQGAVDRASQRVAWTVGDKGRVVFQTGLQDLTQENGALTVHFENGQVKLWNLVRVQPSSATASR